VGKSLERYSRKKKYNIKTKYCGRKMGEWKEY
jgi:hypothetical protein